MLLTPLKLKSLMRCLNPITLRNGYVVPCGKCELCLSARRNNWSVRVQIHADCYERMPLFVTLTYDNDNVPYGDGALSLSKNDLSLFIKRYKDRYTLYNTTWSYFGCGEYGDKFDRPHYHLIIFGDDKLYECYDESTEKARQHVYDVWKKGLVHVCVAEWSGIHYVTKYTLKECPDDWSGTDKEKPFTACSQGIGMAWLNTLEADKIRTQLERITVWRNEYLDMFQDLHVNPSDVSYTIHQLKEFFNKMPDFPTFEVMLPSGKRAYLPREIRRKLVGSFEHFKDSPLWLFEHYKRLLESLEYYRDNGKYDLEHDLTAAQLANINRVEKIRQSLILKKHKKLYETI